MVGRRHVARLLAGTFLLAGSAGMAKAEVRALNLINTHTQERATVVFKRDGVYDQNGLQELNRLLRDWRRNEVTRMDPQLFDLIWEVYRKTGAQDPIHIVCGYRSPATNNMLRSRSRGVAKLSQHMLGKAMDFYLPDVPLSTLRETGMKMQVGGVGFYPTSGSPFVHMDTGSVRAWPRMTRDQLVRLFPDGKTAHLPADGEPLSGYQQALADSETRKARGAGAAESSSSGGGLLAALFGGGSSSRSTPTRVAAADDDEEGGAPAPAPARSRMQELRQGPLPPGSNPKIMARGDETPPGVAPTLAQTPVPNVAPKPRPPQQQLALAAEPAPIAPPPPPVPTTQAKGSLVAMPVVGSQAPLAARGAPAPAPAAEEARPSRFAVADNGLPPGWVVGPSGQGAGAPAAAAQPAPLPTLSANLKPIAVPLPMPNPRLEVGLVVAAATGRPLAPGEVSMLPRPRPTGSMRTAALGDEARPADPAAAFAALTGDDDRLVPMMGYAPAGGDRSAPREPVQFSTASLPPAAAPAQPAAAPRNEARVASLGSAALPAGALQASAAGRAKADRGTLAAAVSKPVAKSDRATSARVFDAPASTAGETFAQLRHPDQGALDGLMTKPRMVLAIGFSQGFGPAEPTAFTGTAVVAQPVIVTE